ncbi:retrovirus-related Pol polyprotein from transposon 17.6 [Nephila pilipes]|uniref:Retrovirus-related Pol polyprotein from transposon 17.6 n=1 Tax=Nephila pilipes TaxID=299642 RepID=A0A8X6NB05_NEPPI|nr:retrovirus-related Pol polyprotein from transposon 17.6 [Nephila pilipes]
MQEFMAHQSERKLKHNESLVDYIYSKDALLEKAPFTIPQPNQLIDRATALDAIRSAKQEHKKHSTKSQIRSSYTYDEQRHKYNPITDDVRDIVCWRCGIKGHASFMCSLPPPPCGSTIAQPRNMSRQNQYSNSQTSVQFPSSSSSTSSNNHALVETTSLKSSNSHRNNNNRNSISGRSTTANNPSINCIRTQMNRRALIPVIINNDTEIQALCDPCADITVIQESCVPSDIVIHPWNDGQFQVVDHEIKPKGFSTTQQAQLDAVIEKFTDVFYANNDNIGLCPYVEFRIELQHEKPIKCRPYRLSEPDRQFLKTQIQKWLKQGICRHSNSPYAAPTFIVDQPFHESTPRRVVVDFSRTINPITKIDPHPIDQMEDVIQRSAGKRYNSKMDVNSAFHCIRIRETDTYKTGFVTPDGHYEFLRMSFGVTNGPSTMTRAIKKAYDHLSPHNVNTYIDDISTSNDDFNYHLKMIYKIFEATQKAGFKLIREKFFLGFANQFRKYIRNYAVIAKPLTSVLKGLGKKTSSAPIVLTDDQQRTFETLKSAITTAPILSYFKQGLPTFVEPDASYSGLGAVLSKEQNGKHRIIEYASRTLKDAETRYHSNELECTAVHWALTEKFRFYLLGHKIQLITDNYTTAYVVAKSAINRKFARYLTSKFGSI